MKPILRAWILLVSGGLIAAVQARGCGPVAASEAAVLNGRLFDSESRAPVAGALLVPRGRPERGAASGEDGRFRIPWEGGEAGSVAVTAEGYLPAVVEVAGPDGELVLALRPAASLAGRVVEAQDRPLEGAAVGLELVDTAAPGRVSPERTTVTAGDGRFRFDGLEPGHLYRLRLAKDGHVSRFRKLPELAARHYDAGDVALPRGRRVAGGAGGADGKPVAGARISLWEVSRSSPEDHRPSHDARTGPGGRFAFRRVAPGFYHLLAAAPGHRLSVRLGVEIGAGEEPLELEPIRLLEGAELTGRAIDDRGRAVAGAEVRVTGSKADPTFLRRHRWQVLGATGRTDGDGRFRLGGLRPGEQVSLHATSPGLTMDKARVVVVPAATDAAEIPPLVLRRHSRLVGRVVDRDGRGVAGAELWLTEIGAPENHGIRQEGRDFVRTDAEGRFTLDNAPAGEVSLHVRAPGHAPRRMAGVATVAGKETSVEIPLEAFEAAEVEVRVAGPDGVPVPGIEVALDGSLYVSFDATGRGTTGVDGRVVLRGIPAGTYGLRAHDRDSRRSARRTVTVEPGQSSFELELDALAERRGEVAGRVVDAAGRPVAGAQVVFERQAPRFGIENLTSGADGRFTAEVPTGDYKVWAESAGFAPARLAQPLRVGAEGASGLELVLRPGATLSGRLEGLREEELHRLYVSASPANGYSVQGIVDSRARYTFRNLGPGRWTVSARRSGGGAGARGTVTLAPGDEHAELDLVFPEGSTLTGNLIHRGAPLAGAGVSLMRDDERRSAWSAATDPAGHFEISGLPPGGYDLRVSVPGPGRIHSQRVELDGARHLEIVLGAARVSGRVVERDSGRGVAGAFLRPILVEIHPRGLLSEFTHERALGITADSEGRFTFGPLEEGRWKFRATRQGYASAEASFEIRDGVDVDDLEIVMEHSAVLLLEIETSLGNVPESVRTRLEDEDGKRILGKSHYLGGDREVRWEEVPPGSWQLVVESDLEALARLPVRVPGPAVRIVLRSVGALETRVPGLVGEPVEAMFELLDVEGRSVRGPFRLHPESHHRGVRLNRLRPGTYVVRVSAEDGRSWQEVVVVAGDRKSEVVLE